MFHSALTNLEEPGDKATFPLSSSYFNPAHLCTEMTARPYSPEGPEIKALTQEISPIVMMAVV